MTRKILPRLLAAAATLAALAAALTAFSGTGLAEGSAAQANYAPVNTAAPTISGNAQVGETLTASTGSWSYQSTPSYSFQWERCNSSGASCANLSGATSSKYVVQSGDAGATLRVVVTAHNADGTTSATSSPTAVVSQPGPGGVVDIGNGKKSIPASSVVLPARLVIDGVQFQPRRIQGRSSFLARFHVSDTRGYAVRDALVYALGLPYSWVQNSTEVRTDQTGWAAVTITPSARLPVSRGHALVLFVRARVQGQPVLAGSSARRLVQITTAGR